MILDPQQFVSTEMSRHHAMAEALAAVPVAAEALPYSTTARAERGKRLGAAQPL